MSEKANSAADTKSGVVRVPTISIVEAGEVVCENKQEKDVDKLMPIEVDELEGLPPVKKDAGSGVSKTSRKSLTQDASSSSI